MGLNENKPQKEKKLIKQNPKKYLTPEESKIEAAKLLDRKKILDKRLQIAMDKYIKFSSLYGKMKGNIILYLSKKISKLQAELQRIEIDLMRLEKGTYLRLNFFQKIIKRFSLLSYHKQKVVFGIIFLIPWFIGFCIFFAIPMGKTIIWSFYDLTQKTGGGFDKHFIGLSNFYNLFTTATIGGATIHEVLFKSILNLAINLPTIIIFSLFIAVLLNSKFKGHQIVKAIFFIPVVFNLNVINNTLTGTFGQLFGSNLNEGFVLATQFSDFLMKIGIGNGLVEFLTDAVNRIFSIVNMSGIQIIIFIAALQSIPSHLYEAAKVEGATKYEMFWKITIPMISPMILTAIVYTVVDSFNQSEIIKFMTVNSQGTTMATNQAGMFSAISIIYFLMNAAIIGLIFLLMKRVVFYHDK